MDITGNTDTASPTYNHFRDKIILVTGGAGAIGRNLTERLSVLGAKLVIVFDNLSSSYLWNIPDSPNVLFVKGDIRNDNDLRRVFHHKPELIFHLAAFFANQNSVDYPLVNEEVNIAGMLKLLEYCQISGSVERFVFANSEGGVYGVETNLPHREDDITLNLATPYYISKLAGEAYCRYYHSYYGLPVSIVRLFNSYGPGEVPGQYRNVIPNFIYWAMKGLALPLTGNAEMARDFVYVDDTINGLLSAAVAAEALGNAVNICSGKLINIHDLAGQINQLTGNSAGVRLIPNRKWDVRNQILGDPGKAKEIIGFEAKTNFNDGLIKTISWFQNNWDVICRDAEFPPGRSAAHSNIL